MVDRVAADARGMGGAVERVVAHGVGVELGGGITCRSARAELGGGVTVRGQVAQVPALDLLDVSVEVDLERFLEASGGDGSGLGVGDLDLGLLDPVLDAVEGRASIDAVVGLLASPAMPRVRNAVRLAIQGGSIDFKELERGLPRLADSVLDFRVEGARLELEKDIPFVPWDEATLLAWELDPADQALAARGRIRLRRLLDVEVVDARTRAKGKRGCFGFGSVALEGIDIDVVVGPGVEVPIAGGAVLLGRDGAPAVERVQLQGAVRCARGQAPGPSAITIAMRGVSGALRGVHALGLALDAARLEVADVTGELAFEGLRPTRLALSLPRVHLEGVTVELPATAHV